MWTGCRGLCGLMLLAILPGCATVGSEPSAAPPDAFAAATSGLEAMEGLLPLFLDREGGRVRLLLPPADAQGIAVELLYVEGLTRGLGSNPVGLDRGQLGPARVVRFREVGGRVVLEVPNLAFRAVGAPAAEVEAVEESFASSILWACDILGRGPLGGALVDLTSFLVRDAHRVEERLRDAGQGSFNLDPMRSVVDVDATLAFPDNLELEAILTFAGADPGAEVVATAAVPDAVTLVQHHSFVRLPDDGFEPRPFDPRAGSFAVTVADYAVPLDEPVTRRFAVRHRLEKVDPTAERSPVVEPIVYYVDAGVPEPVRSALVEGASWWADAFAAAGFEDAFRVEILPPDAHPLDLRYHVIQWVHRATRGWSYGGGVIDPRTGEMIKGHVSLGSLRVRQDRLLFEGLLGVESTASGQPDDPIELALARIRQLAAHEVGHTLGLAHNFAASTYGDRASVMDYPAPLLAVTSAGTIDASRAYARGVGDWDRHAIRRAYAEPPPGVAPEAFLAGIVDEGLAAGYLFLTDSDAQPPGAAHPLASLWDNGSDPVAALASTLAVRAVALERFGVGNVASGTPLALLQEVLATVYLHHRFQVGATAKTLGGVVYAHALRGDGQPPARPVGAERQRAALEGLLVALEPASLDLPDEVLALLLPRPPEHGANRELFPAAATAPLFDPLGAAATAADLVVAELLQPERTARLVDQHRRDPSLPGFEEVVARLVEVAWREPTTARLGEVAAVIRQVVVDRLLLLGSDASASMGVRARAEAALVGLVERVRTGRPTDRHLGRVIERFFADGTLPGRAGSAPPPPPGSPIGTGCSFGAR